MQRKESSAVSSTMVMLMPSTPTKYSMLKVGIHVAALHELEARRWRSKLTNRADRQQQRRHRERRRRPADQHRLAPDGRQRMTAAPTSGMKIINVSNQCSIVSFSLPTDAQEAERATTTTGRHRRATPSTTT